MGFIKQTSHGKSLADQEVQWDVKIESQRGTVGFGR